MRWLAVLAALWVTPALATTCSDTTFEGMSYSICEVDPAQDDLRLFLNDAEGAVLGSFSALRSAVGPLAFAMNAGMYHPDRAPVGLYVEQGTEVMHIVANPGPGNFGMVPNGVFCITDTSAFVIETLAFERDPPACRDATQSGPMLVIDGTLHPRFIAGSDFRNIRNGVGTSDDGSRAVFAISNDAVNFDEFARFFRDGLGLPNALYFDGRVSRLYAPSLGRNDLGVRMGPMVGVVDQAGAGG